MIISDLLKDKGDRMIYRYDFGDNWEHAIELEELYTPQKGEEFRMYMDGERRCPPEDCGGVNGFYEMLKILNNPDDPETQLSQSSYPEHCYFPIPCQKNMTDQYSLFLQ